MNMTDVVSAGSESDNITHASFGPKNELPQIFFKENHITSKHWTVVIVGAGISGLAAAQRLIERGCSSVLVLEAQDHPGGRIHTINFGDGVLDLGAQWVHGEKENPLFEYAQNLDILSDPRTEYSVEGRGLFYSETAEQVPEIVVDETLMALENIKEDIYKLFSPIESNNYLSNSVSVGEFFKQKFEVFLEECEDLPHVQAWRRGIYEWFLKHELAENACNSLNDLSCCGFAEWTVCPGNYLINFKNGFQSVIKSLSKDIPSKQLCLSKPVSCIHWQEMHEGKALPTVTVECSDGDRICADHVILTTSVGYLKQTNHTLFSPPLPDKKQELLTHLGFGSVEKIFLVFDTPFWSDSDLGFQFVWTSSTEESSEWVRGIRGFDTVKGHSNVLLGWISGKDAELMQTLGEEEVKIRFAVLLRTFLGRNDITLPSNVIRSSWQKNQYICGAYSYRSVTYTKLGFTTSILAEPLYCKLLNKEVPEKWPVVLFAGEATDQDFFSSAHGGLRSGLREADRLLLLKRLLLFLVSQTTEGWSMVVCFPCHRQQKAGAWLHVFLVTDNRRLEHGCMFSLSQTTEGWSMVACFPCHRQQKAGAWLHVFLVTDNRRLEHGCMFSLSQTTEGWSMVVCFPCHRQQKAGAWLYVFLVTDNRKLEHGCMFSLSQTTEGWSIVMHISPSVLDLYDIVLSYEVNSLPVHVLEGTFATYAWVYVCMGDIQQRSVGGLGIQSTLPSHLSHTCCGSDVTEYMDAFCVVLALTLDPLPGQLGGSRKAMKGGVFQELTFSHF
ncbi:spermine oxidase-like [Tachypleus tridentatus]|uniref:spermine oxidase-like n=1 Tax=Tachypleus tridentatus TaxID=6853 RepID=UPI003FD3BAE0